MGYQVLWLLTVVFVGTWMRIENGLISLFENDQFEKI